MVRHWICLLGIATLAGAAQAQDASAKAGMPATHAVVALKTELSSRSDKQGKEIFAHTIDAAVLPDGTKLPKGTIIHGTVAQVSVHSKSKPNGALMLLFDEARPKDAPPIPLLAKIKSVAPSAESQISRNDMPGARLGGSSNSGGAQQKQYTSTDHTDMRYNEMNSTLDGVMLQTASAGSGVLYALDEDVRLFEGIQLTLVIARAPKGQ